MSNETREKYGWLAVLIAGVILGIGRVVYAVFRAVFSILSSWA